MVRFVFGKGGSTIIKGIAVFSWFAILFEMYLKRGRLVILRLALKVTCRVSFSEMFLCTFSEMLHLWGLGEPS